MNLFHQPYFTALIPRYSFSQIIFGLVHNTSGISLPLEFKRESIVLTLPAFVPAGGCCRRGRHFPPAGEEGTALAAEGQVLLQVEGEVLHTHPGRKTHLIIGQKKMYEIYVASTCQTKCSKSYQTCLLQDYLHCFKKESSRLTEMGVFIFKVLPVSHPDSPSCLPVQTG